MGKKRKMLDDGWLNSLPNDSPKDVASSIKTYFKRKKISLASVAKEIEISPQLLSYYLNGKKYPPASFAKTLSYHYTEFSESYIWGGIGDTFEPDDVDLYGMELCKFSPNFNYSGLKEPVFENGLGKVNKGVVGRYYQDLLESLFGNFMALKQNQETINDLMKDNEKYIDNLQRIFDMIRDKDSIINAEEGPSKVGKEQSH